MPTASQWCGNVNATRKRVTAWNPGGGGWAGGSWRSTVSEQLPTVRKFSEGKKAKGRMRYGRGKKSSRKQKRARFEQRQEETEKDE